MRRILSVIVLILVSSFSFATAQSTQNTRPIQVVASFSVLADIVKNIGGDKISITSIVGPNQDAHEYELKPSDLIAINKSKIVFINGLGLEAGWINGVKGSYKGNLVVVSKGISPFLIKNDMNKTQEDPHVWNNPMNVVNYYIPNILKALVLIDPQDKAYFTKNANEYTKKITDLNSWVKVQLALIPVESRRAVTTHDAFNYFARTYNINFISAQGVSTDSDASAKDIADLEKVIKSSKVKVVFLENMTNNKLIRQIALDTHARVGGELYSDALSTSKQQANTYINMIQYNVKTLIKAWSN